MAYKEKFTVENRYKHTENSELIDSVTKLVEKMINRYIDSQMTNKSETA